jgi:hypothetical protein
MAIPVICFEAVLSLSRLAAWLGWYIRRIEVCSFEAFKVEVFEVNVHKRTSLKMVRIALRNSYQPHTFIPIALPFGAFLRRPITEVPHTGQNWLYQHAATCRIGDFGTIWVIAFPPNSYSFNVPCPFSMTRSSSGTGKIHI